MIAKFALLGCIAFIITAKFYYFSIEQLIEELLKPKYKILEVHSYDYNSIYWILSLVGFDHFN
jgi:hypothetical protein